MCLLKIVKMLVQVQTAHQNSIRPVLKQQILEFLEQSKATLWAIGGTSTWSAVGADLGQTAVFTAVFIYNDSITITKKFGRTTVIFEKISNFPKSTSKEFWFIDVLNHKHYLDPSDDDMIKCLLQKIQTHEIDADRLKNEANSYGNPETMIVLQSVFAK